MFRYYCNISEYSKHSKYCSMLMYYFNITYHSKHLKYCLMFSYYRNIAQYSKYLKYCLIFRYYHNISQYSKHSKYRLMFRYYRNISQYSKYSKYCWMDIQLLPYTHKHPKYLKYCLISTQVKFRTSTMLPTQFDFYVRDFLFFWGGDKCMTSKKILGNERKQPRQKNHNYRDVNISKFPHRLQTRDPFSPYFPTLPR